MKKLLQTATLIILISVVLFSFWGCSSTRTNFDKLVGQNDELRIYEIFGMDCPGCHGGLENLINKVEGVKGSKANWEKQQLKVIIASGAEVTDEAIYEAVKAANFTPGKRIK